MAIASARLYETDFYGWIQQQANVLKAGSFASLDLENLIEEIESMGKSHRRALASRFEILLIHLLKWQFQPNLITPSWRHTIKEQRRRITEHLQDNPSLKPHIEKEFNRAYGHAIMGAAGETGLKEETFSVQCPWTYEEVMNPDFWPAP